MSRVENGLVPPIMFDLEAAETVLQWWAEPEGVEVEGDPDGLKFLLVPVEVEQMITQVSLVPQILKYQARAMEGEGVPIERGVFVMMGGATWASWVHDGIAWMGKNGYPEVEFDGLGVSYYAGPGRPLEEPRVVHDFSMEVEGKGVLVVEDLVDLGGTAPFVARILRERGAADVVLSAAFVKGELPELSGISKVFWFGRVPKDTWIITGRERVETMIKRVPDWLIRSGLSEEECKENLRRIGYPEYLIDLYFRYAVEAARVCG